MLRAGQHLFLDRGIDGTSVEDITRAAGVSKGLFYLHFRSKDDYVAAMQQAFSIEFAGAVAAAAASTPAWPQKVDAVADALARGFRSRSDLHEVIFWHGADAAEAAGAGPHQALVDGLQTFLEDGMREGAFEVNDPRSTALLLVAAVHALDAGFGGEPRPTPAALRRALRELLHRAAGSPPT